MKKSMVRIVSATVLALLLASCGQSADMAPRSEYLDLMSPPAMVKAVDTELARAEEQELSSEPLDSQTLVRRRITTGTMQLEVRSLAQAESAISTYVQGLGGYVSATSSNEQWGSMTLRIPADKLEEFLSGLEGQGRVKSKNLNVQDVTEQYFDVQTRLTNQRLLLDQYREFMAQASLMSDILDVMRKITDLTSDIEVLEGQLRYLNDQIALSTIHLELVLPVLAGGREWPDLGGGFQDFGYTLLNFGYGLLFFILGLVVIGPFVLGVVWLVVWLGFGKPGILRRLFGMVRGSQSVPPPKS